MPVRRILWMVSAALVVLGLAGTAGARQFSMTGQWYRNTGPLVDIPINGGVIPCTPATAGAICVGNLRPLNGGIPNAPGAVVSATGSAPAQLTLPQNVFQQNLGKQVVAIPFVPTVVQLSTQFILSAPYKAVGLSGVAPGVLRAGAWTTQTGRAAANFGWCPGAPVNPACTNPNPAVHGGTNNGLVRYTAQPNAFGGTMGLLVGGTGVVSVRQVASPTGTLLLHQLVGFGATMTTQRLQANGRGYSAMLTNMLVGGPIHLGYMTAAPCTVTIGGLPVALPPGCGQITSSGPQIGTLSNDLNTNFGFPWTTGTVFVRNTGTNNGQPGTSTLSAMGTDGRTAFGAGNITLVAGGYTHRLLANQDFSSLDVITMSLTPSVAPSASPTGLAAGALLMLLAVGVAVRRRR